MLVIGIRHYCGDGVKGREVGGRGGIGACGTEEIHKGI